MSNSRPINRDTAFLLPPSVDEWLPQRHLARFVVEVVERLDLVGTREGLPRLGVGLVSPGDAALAADLRLRHAECFRAGRSSGRRYDSVAFRFIAGNEHPDHDTIARFRKRFLGQIEALFVEVLKLARTWGCSSSARSRSMAPRCTPTRAGTARSPTVMRRRSRSS